MLRVVGLEPMAQRWLAIVSKFGDHLPVYRQAEIFKRRGIHLTVGRAATGLMTDPAGIEPSGGRFEGTNARSAGRPRVSEACAATLRAILNGHPESGIEDLMPWRVQQPSSLAA